MPTICTCSSHFYTNLYILFIYEDIRFGKNIYGCENMSIKNFILILKQMAPIADCKH